MRPSAALERHREEIRRMAASHRLTNPRVFGSVLHRTDREDSDLDILVDPSQETTLFNVGALQVALERLTGVRVDVQTPGALPPRLRDRIISEAKPV